MTDEEKTLRLANYALLVLLIAPVFLIVGLWALFTPAHAENFPDYGDAVGCEHPFCGPGRMDPSKDYVIRNDKGGLLFIYVVGYAELKHTHIIVDGGCSSACSLVLGNADVCSTDRGFFYFHAALRDGGPNPEGTAYLMSVYPQKVKDWIMKHGGLTNEWIGAHGHVFLPKCEAK
jgi:hypothetical protein